MKKSIYRYILLSLFPIVLTIAYTSAWFSGQTVSSENVLKSGTLILRSPGEIISQDEFKSIYPGWQDCKIIKLYNDGSLNLKCKMGIYCDDNSLLYSGESCIKVSISDGNGNYYCKDREINKIKNVVLSPINNGSLESIKMEMEFPKEADNSYNGIAAKLKFVFDAVQENTPQIFNVQMGDNIQSIIDCADAGDIINVSEGTFNEELHISKSITLNGEVSGRSKLAFSGDMAEQEVIRINDGVKNVNINDIAIDGVNQNISCVNLYGHNGSINFNNVTFSNGKCSLWITGNASNIGFKNSVLKDNSKYCVHFNSGMIISNISFDGCSFYSNLYSINAISANGAVISNLQFKNCQYKNVIQYK